MHEPPSQPLNFVVGEEDQHLILPPSHGADICLGCRSINYEPVHEFCENCRLSSSQLDGSIATVDAIALYAKPGRLRDWLTFYKSEDERFEDPQAVAAVAQVLTRFFDANEDWLSQLNYDYAVVVPSTRRKPPHPLHALLELVRPATFQACAVLERTAQPLAPRKASTDAYTVNQRVSGDRILLIDDVYASGARAQSAAYTLRAADAEVVSLLVIGRRINPAYSERAAQVFAEQSELPFEWNLGRRAHPNMAP